MIILLLASSAALADSGGEASSNRHPDAPQLIGTLYRFDRFQHMMLESAELSADAEVTNLAALRAEDAAKRDRTLEQIQRSIGVEPRTDKAPINSPYAEASDSEGPGYVRRFYAAQVTEYQVIVSSIERYLQAPDQDRLRSFAREQLPVLQSQLRAAERAMADSSD